DFLPAFCTSLGNARRAPPVSRLVPVRQRRRPGAAATQAPRLRSLRSVVGTTQFTSPAQRQESLMRAVILIFVVIIVAIIAAIATGFLDINRIRGGKTPQ